MKETDLKEIRQYRFFREFKEPILYDGLLVYGIFPYHTATLLGNTVTNHTREEFKDLEKYLQENAEYYITNKFLIVGDRYCVYCHDFHARKGDYTNIKDYSYRDAKPIKKDQTYDEWYAEQNINPKFYR